MKRVLIMASLSIFPSLLAAQGLELDALVGERWYGLYLNNAKAGYCSITIERPTAETVAITTDMQIQADMGGIQQRMHTLEKRSYGPDGALSSISVQIEDAGNAINTFDAYIEGDELVLNMVIGGTAQQRRFPRPNESLTDALKEAQLTGKTGAQVGDSLRFAMFDVTLQKEVSGISSIAASEERILEGAPTRVFTINTKLETLGISTHSYVTERGIVLEDTYEGSLTMRLEQKEAAQDLSFNNDVIVQNAVVLDAPVENARNRDELTLRISGPLKTEHLFNTLQQTISPQDDGSYIFVGRRISLDALSSSEPPVMDEQTANWLKPTTYVQCDNPRLIETARNIVNGSAAPIESVRRLSAWVNANVRTLYSARLSNALEVLDNLEGDCTEHSILFVGLARAAGIPAREAAGLVYVDHPKSGFYFHQWASVWIGEWIDVDPTFGQVPADATHIKLSEGDLSEQVKLLPLIGQLRIEHFKPGAPD